MHSCQHCSSSITSWWNYTAFNNINIQVISFQKTGNYSQIGVNEHKAVWKPLAKALKSKGVRKQGKKREVLWLHFTCQWHTAGTLLGKYVAVFVPVCLQDMWSEHVCTGAHMVCVGMCIMPEDICTVIEWRQTRDSCPVPFTAQSSQPPLCSVRLLMRINVLWCPLRLPTSTPQKHS